LPYAKSVSRPHAGYHSRVFRLALRSHRAQNAAASTASAPRVRDDHDTPLLWGGMARLIKMFLPTMEAKYFCKWGWTPLSTNRPTGKSPHGSESKFRSCPGRGAAPFRAAPQSRDLSRRCEMDPGSAAHRYALLSRGTLWPRRRFIRRV
jgi:hypothetical protein